MNKINKLCLLLTLYLAQGLPYGFFTQALPVFLRESGASLPAIGASTLLTLPWALKFLWAPFVDRFGFVSMGLRRSWLIPVQILSVLLFLLISFVSPAENLLLVLSAFLLTNALAATQDVATDGLAIDLLTHEERGWANGVQVAGYRVGMILGGGAILAVYGMIGWTGVMITMAGIALLCTGPVFFYRETERPAAARSRETIDTRRFFREAIHFVFKPGAALWIIVLLLYKSGHAAATAMLRPWLVDRGYSLGDIAWILGTAGFVAGFFGAVVGGLLASRVDRKKLLIPLGFLQAIAVTSYLIPIQTAHATWKVALATSLDHFTSGMATTALFALMMDACDSDRAASDYTVQACLIVIATGLAATMSGWSAQVLGYETHFGLSAALGFFAASMTVVLLSRPSVRGLLK